MHAPSDLKNYLNDQTPFGPADADRITDPYCRRQLFSTHNKLYKSFGSRTTLVIGRKGSGKTALLGSVMVKPEYLSVILKTHLCLTTVSELVAKGQGANFIEILAELWETALTVSVIPALIPISGAKSRSVLTEYIRGLNIKETATADQAFQAFFQFLTTTWPTELSRALLGFRSFRSGASYEEVSAVMSSVLDAERRTAVVLLDSLDEYPVELPSIRNSLAGLFKAIAILRTLDHRVEARLCLPAENIVQMQEISSNPAKDFENQLVLRWHSKELIALAAKRYSLFLQVSNPAHAEQYKFDEDKDDAAKKYLNEFLPNQVSNRLGGRENPIAYVLRHTQLSPRQFLIYLNAVFNAAISKEKTRHAIKEQYFVEGVRQTEGTVCAEIFAAYRHLHPNAKKVCQLCLPELPYVFDRSDLQIVFNRHGKKASGLDDFDEFVTLLVNVGVMGRLLSETENYYTAEFQYTTPLHLSLSSNDTYCVHPVFCEEFSVQRPRRGGTKVVYPYGTDFDSEDYR